LGELINENRIYIKDISKEYKDEFGFKVSLLKNITLSLEIDKVTSIIAPEGSGKTSLLKIIAGIDNPTGGGINYHHHFKNICIPTISSSFPWMTVVENIKFARPDISGENLNAILELIGLDGYENHIPNNKSTGFRYRISLGRALAANPDFIILDEPFLNMDIETKEECYQLTRDIFLQKNIPFVLGTNNITEAVFLSDKIYLMKKNPGEIIDFVDNTLPKNRNLNSITSSQFNEIRVSIEETFKMKESYKSLNFSI